MLAIHGRAITDCSLIEFKFSSSPWALLIWKSVVSCDNLCLCLRTFLSLGES